MILVFTERSWVSGPGGPRAPDDRSERNRRPARCLTLTPRDLSGPPWRDGMDHFRQHTGRSDFPHQRGEHKCAVARRAVAGTDVQQRFTSPLECGPEPPSLRGFGPVVQGDPELIEWDPANTTARPRPDPPGESRLVAFSGWLPRGRVGRHRGGTGRLCARSLRTAGGRVLLFGHGHFFRVLARAAGLPPQTASSFFQSTPRLAFWAMNIPETNPSFALWNDDRHVAL